MGYLFQQIRSGILHRLIGKRGDCKVLSYHVILSETKNLVVWRLRSFASAQDDNGETIRLFWSTKLMQQYVSLALMLLLICMCDFLT